jgi:hypothetical protein
MIPFLRSLGLGPVLFPQKTLVIDKLLNGQRVGVYLQVMVPKLSIQSWDGAF